MKLFLLTHERELDKKTNTGQMVLDALGSKAERVIWQRTCPPENIVELIEDNRIALLYPCDDEESCGDIRKFENFIILDSTWQESRKIYNKSPYLKQAVKIGFNSEYVSRYTMRRNQIQNGLCTAECVIELLKLRGEQKLASDVQERFEQEVLLWPHKNK